LQHVYLPVMANISSKYCPKEFFLRKQEWFFLGL
jgi:hypothetical protein